MAGTLDNDNKYGWTEHVKPQQELPGKINNHANNVHIEDEVINKPRKITLEEAEYKRAVRQMQLGTKTMLPPIVENKLEELELPNLATVEKTAPVLKTISEKKIAEKLAKITSLANKQWAYLANVAQDFTSDFNAIIMQYKQEQTELEAKLAVAEQAKETIEENYNNLRQQNQKLENTLATILHERDGKREAMQQQLEHTLKQLEKLEIIVKTEQKLRKEVESRANDALNKVKQFKVLGQQEQELRAAAELQVQKTTQRAKEVMSYFLNSAFMDEKPQQYSKQHDLVNNLTGFDSLMLNRKALKNQ